MFLLLVLKLPIKALPETTSRQFNFFTKGILLNNKPSKWCVTDIIEVERVEKLLAKSEQFKEKIFTAKEITYCETKKNKAQNYAARYAAKEALKKASLAA